MILINKHSFLFLAVFLVLFLGLLLSFTTVIMADEGGKETNEDSSRLVIRNNKLSESGFGIYIGPRDQEVLIKGNTLEGNAEAIRLTGVKRENLVKNNKIVNNLAGITLRDKYSSNEKGYVKYPVDPNDIKIINNKFASNEEGNILNFIKNKDSSQKESTSNSDTPSSSNVTSKSVESNEEGDEGKTESAKTGKSSKGSETSGKSDKSYEKASTSTSNQDSGKVNSSEEKKENPVAPKKTYEGQNNQLDTEGEIKTGDAKGTSSGQEEVKASPDKSESHEIGSIDKNNNFNENKGSTGSGGPLFIAGASAAGLITLLLVLKSAF